MKRKMHARGADSYMSRAMHRLRISRHAWRHIPSSNLQYRLERVLRREGFSKRKSFDITFHMLDWLYDLDTLYRLYRRMDNQTNQEINETIGDFLVHVPHHINAAKFLYGLGEPEDVFHLGFFKRAKKHSKK